MDWVCDVIGRGLMLIFWTSDFTSHGYFICLVQLLSQSRAQSTFDPLLSILDGDVGWAMLYLVGIQLARHLTIAVECTRL
jgi:hypothetical protein